MTKQALLIFTRNPVLGQCKTRLASSVGDNAALEVYKFLLAHTAQVTAALPYDLFVYYDSEIWTDDLWDDKRFFKKLQTGTDLGARMQAAFDDQFKAGYSSLIVIGSDLYDLDTRMLQNAFDILKTNEAVLGPALDGGYYLLGLSKLIPQLFKNKQWGTASVGQATLENLKDVKHELLAVKNDIDYYKDMKDIAPLMDIVTSTTQL